MTHNGITADWIRRDQGVTRATLHAAVAALNLIVFVAITKRSTLVLMKESSEEKEESRVNVSEGG